MDAGQGDAGALTRIRLRVDGRVQGVAYRASAQHQARRLGLTGWVRNLADGAVELEAQGPAAAVAALATWCGHGPSAARVTAVTRTDLAPVPADRDFTIRP